VITRPTMITEGQAWAWASGRVIGRLAGAGVLLAAWVVTSKVDGGWSRPS